MFNAVWFVLVITLAVIMLGRAQAEARTKDNEDAWEYRIIETSTYLFLMGSVAIWALAQDREKRNRK